MVKPLYGGPAFTARLIPLYQMTPDILKHSLEQLVKMVHSHGGDVAGLIGDNHPTNRRCFSNLAATEDRPWIGGGIIPEKNFTMLTDFVHLFKSIRNNWQTEKSQTISLLFGGQVIVAKWAHLVRIYDKEKNDILRRTPLTHASCFPSNMDKQKVSLMVNIFNERTIAALKQDGYYGTAAFVALFTRVWHILNIKSVDAHIHLNDPDRKPFTSIDDPRLSFLLEVADAVSKLHGGKGHSRTASFTSETKQALVSSLRGIVDLIKFLLNGGFQYVLPGLFQSDRLEGEFGIYR
jgi:hypothetical protein